MSISFLPNRTFWQHELPDLTPFIVRNLGVLGLLIGAKLVHWPRAIRMKRSALLNMKKVMSDIVAENKSDNSVVVIEIQVTAADEDHRRRIALYAHNHDARTIIWIAESFDNEIVAAIEEHNRHPDALFRVFAIACRVPAVVPLAPRFEVVVRSEGGAAGLPDVLPCVGKLHPSAGLWATLLILHPDEIQRSEHWRQNVRLRRKPVAGWRVWWKFVDGEAWVWLSRSGKRAFTEVFVDLQPHAGLFEAQLGVSLACEETKLIALKRRAVSAKDTRDWRALADWLYEQANAREAVLREVLKMRREPPLNVQGGDRFAGLRSAS